MIRARRLGVTVRGSHLLAGVDLEVVPGRVTAVVGPNGAGKSTLLRILSGELKPTAGTVCLEGRPLAAWETRRLAGRRAVMSQRSTLDFPFRVLEVVLLGRTPHVHRRETHRDHAIARAALAHVAAAHLADRRYSTLSGGERQRVDFARALAQVWNPPGPGKSRYLLLDEPTSSLDLARQHDLLGAVTAFCQEDVAILVVIHDLNLAARYADHLLVLREGRPVGAGPPREILTAELVTRAFGVPTTVIPHPVHGVPLVLPTPALPRGARP